MYICMDLFIEKKKENKNQLNKADDVSINL